MQPRPTKFPASNLGIGRDDADVAANFRETRKTCKFRFAPKLAGFCHLNHLCDNFRLIPPMIGNNLVFVKRGESRTKNLCG